MFADISDVLGVIVFIAIVIGSIISSAAKEKKAKKEREERYRRQRDRDPGDDLDDDGEEPDVVYDEPSSDIDDFLQKIRQKSAPAPKPLYTKPIQRQAPQQTRPRQLSTLEASRELDTIVKRTPPPLPPANKHYDTMQRENVAKLRHLKHKGHAVIEGVPKERLQGLTEKQLSGLRTAAKKARTVTRRKKIAVGGLLATTDDLKNAVVLSEILGRPRAEREYDYNF